MNQVNIQLSGQAELILRNLDKINQDELIDWFCQVRKISIGGGDVLDYLKYLESMED